ncbi:hypothetical protein ANRL3_01609 [Anaerolineae bacterium]|nr:hypothetical protein ANRL3_01609 [Anaerolineae bacterium]
MDFVNELTPPPFHCPHCRSDLVVKNGHNLKGKQQYRCKRCGKSGVLNPSVRYTEEQKKEILSAYYTYRSLRRIERMFGVTRETVAAWLKKKTLGDEQAPVSRYPATLIRPTWYARQSQEA